MTTEKVLPGIKRHSSENLMAYIEEIKETVIRHSMEAERNRGVSMEVIHLMYELGLFNLWVPKVLGGADVDPLTTIKFLEELAALDASTAWSLMIGIEINGLISTYTPYEVVEEFFADDDRPAIGGGVVMPGGSLDEIEKGTFNVTGLWAYGSGCKYASWMLGSCIFMEYGMPRMGRSGNPQLYAAMLPASKITIDDTWHTLGMRGTGSNHWGVKNEVIDAKYIWPIDSKPIRDNQATRFPGAVLFSITKASIALGIAKSAAEHFKTWALNTQPFGSNYYVSEDSGIQIEYAKNIAKLESARSFLFSAVERIGDVLKTGGFPSDYEISLAHLASVNSATSAFDIVSALCYLSGASAVSFDKKPLQQKLRDITTIRGHISLTSKMTEASGACLLNANPSIVVPFWEMNYSNIASSK